MGFSSLATYLAQGHFDMRTGGARDQTADLLISGQPALPPEPQLPFLVSCGGVEGRLPPTPFPYSNKVLGVSEVSLGKNLSAVQ